MAIKYGTMNVDERYAKIFEPNLYFDSWLVPGATYTDKYMEGPAGAIYVHKLATSGAVDPELPGGDFTHENTADALIQITLNNAFQRSVKIYQVAANAIAAPLANEKLSVVTAEVREGRHQAALACLYTEGKKSSTTTEITADNVKQMIIAERTALSKAKGRANVILASPDTFAAILTAAGKEFTPERNNSIQMSGQVGSWYGFTIIECNGLATSAAVKYNDYSGTAKTVTAANLNTVDFIMYYHEAFSVVSNLDAFRLIDAIDFIGSYAQVSANIGYRVTNSDLVRIKTHTAA